MDFHLRNSLLAWRAVLVFGLLVGAANFARGANTTETATAAEGFEEVVVIESPDGRIEVCFEISGVDNKTSAVCYSVMRDGRMVVGRSWLSLDLKPAGPLGAVRVTAVEQRTSDTTYRVFPGKTGKARDHYNEAVVSLAEVDGDKRQMDIIFRAYDDGVAFRYHVPKQAALKNFTVAEETSSFCIAGNPTTYALPVKSFDTPYEFYYEPMWLNQLSFYASPSFKETTESQRMLALPLMMKYADGSCIAITEAHLHDYAGMYLRTVFTSGIEVVAETEGTTAPGTILYSKLAPLPGEPDWLGFRKAENTESGWKTANGIKVKADLPHSTPWRVIMMGDGPGDLIESNIINNLNPPSVIKDTSWIKPGKTMFPWWNGYASGPDVDFEMGLNTKTMKHYIDFCAESGFEYFSLDGFDNVAWYGGKIRPYAGADITTTTLPDLDFAEVRRYAKEKGVGLRLWMNSRAAQKHMHRAFPLYEKWGIEGVMLDFFDRDDQEIVNFIHEAVALAAKHHLTVTLHNCYKPTGLNRTYPNLMTYEAVLNLEYNKWSERGSDPEHELIVPFTRMLTGPLDYHSGGFRYVSKQDFEPRNVAPLVIGTRARELARYVVYEGYLPMAADYPAAYRGEDGLDVLVDMPTSWDETRVLIGTVGDYITVARRKGKVWYVGSMTDGQERELKIPLDFLSDGNFTAEIFSDDMAAGAERKNLKRARRSVKAGDVVTAKMNSAGGHLMILKPEKAEKLMAPRRN